jgi:hypothetical protein
MTLNEKFEKIYCINLDRRNDRWERTSSLFNRFGVSVERVSGIEDVNPWNGLRMTVIGIMQNAINLGYERILILEDDVEWADNFVERFDKCWNSLPDDWDMFYFSAAHQYWPTRQSELLFKLKWSTAAHAIAFNKKCLHRILCELISKMDPIDVTYSMLQPVLNAYCCIEPIAWQRRSYSDIEKEEKWYPYLKDLTFYERYMKGLVTVDDKLIKPE